MSSSSNVTFLTQPKSKKAKSRASKRKIRKNSEKHIEGRDEELPWPIPDGSSIEMYNHLLGSSLKFSTLDPVNFITSTPMSPVGKSNARMEKQFNSAQKNLEKYFGSNGFNVLTQPRCSPIQSTSNSVNFPCCSANPVAPASSEDVCTLFQNSCQISCNPGNRGQVPPIGVFWDIENCSIPKGRSGLVAVQRIRDRFFPGHYEAEFVCVCDIRKESPGIIQELNDAQVSVVHVSGNSKNAADDKLRQSMRRFADIYSGHHACTSSPFPATIILISGDINFSSDLSDLRHRKKLYVILLHNKHAPDALLLCAHEQYDFHSFLGNLPGRRCPSQKDYLNPLQQNIPLKGGLHAMDVLVCDLPPSHSKTQAAIKNRLKKLSENCGGKVITLQGQFALLRFPNKEAALRASKRMNGEDVLGCKIRVIYSSQMEFNSPDGHHGGIVANPSIPRNPVIHHQFSQGTSLKSWGPTWENVVPVSTRSYVTPEKSQNLQSHPITLHHSNINASNSPSTEAIGPNNLPTKTPQYAPFHLFTPLNNAVRPLQTEGIKTTMEPLKSGYKISNCDTNDLATVDPPGFSALSNHLLDFNIPSSSNGLENVNASASVLLGIPDRSFKLGNSPSGNKIRGKDSDQIDLYVTNIDSNLGDWNFIRETLTNEFSKHVNVKRIWVYMNQEGFVSAVVRVNNKEEGQYAISQLYGKEFGSKRICISFEEGGNVIDPERVKLTEEITSLLQDVPRTSLPLFEFREMFQKRYRRSVSASELFRLTDVVSISESSPSSSGYSLGRTISLSKDWMANNKNSSLHCTMHGTGEIHKGGTEKEAEVLLPIVMVPLKQLTTRVNSILNSHSGVLPLVSFMECYEAEFEKMEIIGSGVPLEHLLACIYGVEINVTESGKRIQFSGKKELDTVVPLLVTQRAQFGREMVDLLKTFPRCSLELCKLLPAYHGHFGRQCRIAEYGHFNLQSLLRSIPHVIQIMGSGKNCILTLSHKAQMKRFTTDLLRVLKAHGGVKKQIKVTEFPHGFSQVFPNRQFSPEDYGLCYFPDLIAELVENSTLVALVTDAEGNELLAVPKREQTTLEIHRKRIFTSDINLTPDSIFSDDSLCSEL